jgi:phosphoglycolate phosphatase-like HAD superfamily hydrolase
MLNKEIKMQKPIYIFDLDGTVIDSSHRFTGTAEGKVNLAKWIEDSTRENIFKDSLLPLAKFMKALMKANQNVWICTARNMSKDDFDFLAEKGIKAKTILCRKDGDHRADAEMKTAKLKRLFNLKQFQNAEKIMFDDNESIQKEMPKIGINCLHQNALMLK